MPDTETMAGSTLYAWRAGARGSREKNPASECRAAAAAIRIMSIKADDMVRNLCPALMNFAPFQACVEVTVSMGAFNATFNRFNVLFM